MRATIARMALPANRVPPPPAFPARDRRPHTGHFRPFKESDEPRSCNHCRHAIGWDSVHVFCRRARIVAVYPCSHWEREAGCD